MEIIKKEWFKFGVLPILLIIVAFYVIYFIAFLPHKNISLNQITSQNSDLNVNNKIKNQSLATTTDVGTLFKQYSSDTAAKILQLNKVLKERKDLQFIKPDIFFSRDLDTTEISFPKINCGSSTVSFTFIPDPYRKLTDEQVVFEDGVVIEVKSSQAGKIIQRKKAANLLNLTKISKDNVDYYLTEEYTGGAHCCYEDRMISCQSGKVNVGDEIDFADISGFDDMFIKNNQLYIKKYDSRFAYFNLSFTSSSGMFYPAFYRYDSKLNKLVDASREFNDYYIGLANNQKQWLIKLRQQQPELFDGAEELWFFPLIQRLVASSLAGEKAQDIHSAFISDFDYFISSEYKDKHFSFPLAKKDAESVYNDAIKIISDKD